MQFIRNSGGDYIIFSDGLKKLDTITHLVVRRDVLHPRRIKFLAALCVCPESVVGYDWIEESVRRGAFLPSDKFHIMRDNAYDINAIEKEYGFSLDSMFQKAIDTLKGGGVLGGKSVYVGPGVLGGGSRPSRDEALGLIAATGAMYHDSFGVKKMVKQGDVTELVVITSDKCVPDAVTDAIEQGAIELSWTDFVSATLKQEFVFIDTSQSSTIVNGRIIDITQQARILIQEEVTDFIKVLSIQLDVSPKRSLSNTSIGDPERESLGPNGIFEVYKTAALRTAVRYVDSKGVVKFESIVPSPEDCHKAIQGNAGRDICIMWDTCNHAFSSGGTTIRGAMKPSDAVAHRRHFFWFNCCDDLKLVMYHLLGNDRGLVNEFFTEKSKFFATEITLPDHTIVTPDGMEEHEKQPTHVGYFGDATVTYKSDPRLESEMF